MKEETQRLVWITGITILVFGLILLFYFKFSYPAMQSKIRAEWQGILTETYYYKETYAQRESIMNKYRLTDDDINPTKILMGVANEEN